jgi:hypothetical protein
MANLVLLCHRHHRSVHEGGWKVVRAEDQRVGVPRFGGHERWSAYNVRELLDAALWECVGEHGGLVACRGRAIEVQMANVYAS